MATYASLQMMCESKHSLCKFRPHTLFMNNGHIEIVLQYLTGL